MYIVKTDAIVKAPVKIEYTALDFWNKLDRADQTTVERESASFFASLQMEGISRYEQAKHLKAIHAVLEPRRVFRRFCEESLRFRTYRTAYRYIKAFNKLGQDIPNIEQVVKVAAARNIELMGYTDTQPYGVYTSVIGGMLPAPTDPKELPAWVESLEAKRQALPGKGRRGRKASLPARARLTEAYREAAKQYRGLPPKDRKDWATKLIGYIMAECSLPAQKFSPEAVPEELQPQRPGRKRKTATAA
jgi:transposase